MDAAGEVSIFGSDAMKFPSYPISFILHFLVKPLQSPALKLAPPILFGYQSDRNMAKRRPIADMKNMPRTTFSGLSQVLGLEPQRHHQ